MTVDDAIADASLDSVRRRLRVRGVVQGVGFRPFVHRLARELDLGGHVGNDAEGVFIEIEGEGPVLGDFQRRLVAEAPPLARIDLVETATIRRRGESDFRIVESVNGAPRTSLPPDVAVCDDCIRELFDPGDQRYRYPFITCTNCGPRFTITKRLPYDRPNTTMRHFDLCPACAAQYHDPTDRRFHAQPVACSDCGPRLRFEHDGVTVDGDDAALAATQQAIGAGAIVAIKGVGGYHLACDATSTDAVGTLRRRKQRPDKPFAVMVRDLSVAHRLACIAPGEAHLLASPRRPIVLLPRRDHSPITDAVAPGNPFVGVMLPYAPLHHLLFREVPGRDSPVPDVLVMTSGNLTDEPICYDDDDARQRLGRIADAWLTHDRPIHVPCDDSVIRVDANIEVPIRRSRGYAPLPVRLPFVAPPTLAVGGELKNTFCLASGRDAWMSQHIGDMGSLETLQAFERSIEQFSDLYDVRPTVLVTDRHPGYQTHRWAQQQHGVEVRLVQHHHAHIASVMVEHGLTAADRVIGIAFDGTGYGLDGAIWGGEVMLAGYADFERVHHLRYVPLPGGDATIRKPVRAALAHLWAAGIAWDDDLAPVAATSDEERAVLRRQLERDVQCVPTSSMGRLFDAVSSLLGVRHVVSYEAQAAIELETIAAPRSGVAREYRFEVDGADIEVAPVLRAIVDDVRRGHPAGAVAAGFHRAVARLVVDVAENIADRTGTRYVALSGGVFQNLLGFRLTRAALAARELTALTHGIVPPNDGGLALGQVAVATCAAATAPEH